MGPAHSRRGAGGVALTTAAILLALAVGFGAGRVKLRRGPVNMVRGMLLPHPGDERWGRHDMCHYEYTCVGGYSLGHVRACPKHGWLFVENNRIPGARRYVLAVSATQVERKTLAAALGES